MPIYQDFFVFTLMVSITNRRVKPSVVRPSFPIGTDRIHVSSSGTLLVVAIEDDYGPVTLDVSNTFAIRLLRPDNTSVVDTAVLYGNPLDGTIAYRILPGDLTIAGTWRLQVAMTVASEVQYSNVTKFKVFDNPF